jgi:hypothetical protein
VSEDEEILLTRRQLVEFLAAKGFPITKRSLDKLCWLGQGPEPECSFGIRHLYSPTKALRWAKSRCKPVHTPVAAE